MIIWWVQLAITELARLFFWRRRKKKHLRLHNCVVNKNCRLNGSVRRAENHDVLAKYQSLLFYLNFNPLDARKNPCGLPTGFKRNMLFQPHSALNPPYTRECTLRFIASLVYKILRDQQECSDLTSIQIVKIFPTCIWPRSIGHWSGQLQVIFSGCLYSGTIIWAPFSPQPTSLKRKFVLYFFGDTTHVCSNTCFTSSVNAPAGPRAHCINQ